VEVQLSPSGQLDLIELIRDLVARDQENRGALPIHGTAAYRPDSCVVISGSKGSGKTTVLLELVERFGYRILSGDKTFLRTSRDGRFVVSGWPDYPHVGYATIDRYDGLRALAGIPDDYVPESGYEFSPYNKYAVDPKGFRARFPSAPSGLACPPTLLIHPNIGPGERTVLTPVAANPAGRAADLEHNLESAFDGPHAGWQTFLPDRTAGVRATHAHLLRLLAEVPAYDLTGPGDLAETELPAEVASPLRDLSDANMRQ
jgi:hypothetical protein